VEVQPQQLAVVVDRGLSTVQDLIDTTACMVRSAWDAGTTVILLLRDGANSACAVKAYASAVHAQRAAID
jgi:hypothetical protein